MYSIIFLTTCLFEFLMSFIPKYDFFYLTLSYMEYLFRMIVLGFITPIFVFLENSSYYYLFSKLSIISLIINNNKNIFDKAFIHEYGFNPLNLIYFFWIVLFFVDLYFEFNKKKFIEQTNYDSETDYESTDISSTTSSDSENDMEPIIEDIVEGDIDKVPSMEELLDHTEPEFIELPDIKQFNCTEPELIDSKNDTEPINEELNQTNQKLVDETINNKNVSNKLYIEPSHDKLLKHAELEFMKPNNEYITEQEKEQQQENIL